MTDKFTDGAYLLLEVDLQRSSDSVLKVLSGKELPGVIS